MRASIRWLLLLATLCMIGCGSSRPGIEGLPGPEGDFSRAKRAFDGRSWIRAVELLSAFVDAHPGSNQLDQALLMLGIAHQHTGENLLAIGDFERLIRDFPQSTSREDAEYERAHSYLLDSPSPPYDPESTETALTLLRAYLTEYPAGTYAEAAQRGIDVCLEKLATKAFLNGQTYLRLQRYAAAAIYFEKALQTKPDFRRAGEAMILLAKVREKLGDRDRAREAWESVLQFASPDRIQKDPRLDGLRQEAEAALRKYPAPAQVGTKS